MIVYERMPSEVIEALRTSVPTEHASFFIVTIGMNFFKKVVAVTTLADDSYEVPFDFLNGTKQYSDKIEVDPRAPKPDLSRKPEILDAGRTLRFGEFTVSSEVLAFVFLGIEEPKWL